MMRGLRPHPRLLIGQTLLLASSLWGCQAAAYGQIPPGDDTIIRKIHLERVAGSAEAKARRLSLPLLRGMTGALVWEGQPTQVQPVGYWPEENGHRAVRRAILLACGETAGRPELARGVAAHGEFLGPNAQVRILEKRYESLMPWEVNELVFSSGSDTLGLRVGLQLERGGYHWWQWVSTEVIEDGPVCRTIRAKGAIPVYWERHESEEARDVARTGGWASYPWLHKHNHVRGEVVARCFSSGVIELFVRHVNGRFFTEGGPLEGVTPVIGFRGQGGDWPEKAEAVTGRRRWRWQGAALDLAAAAHLLSAEHPGRAWREDGVCIYQPYEGVEPMAGKSAKERTGDEFLTRTEQRQIPKGMGRTVRMVASLGPVEPDVAVYILPDWWYGLSEDLCESPLLPVRDQTSATVEKAVKYYREAHHEGCFDDGAIPRGGYRGEPGWEGEAPYAQMLAAYRTTEAVDYDLALRSAYHEADVAVDKALYAVRMHSYPPPAQSLPMQRTLGMIAGYLETGDPYLLETAQSVTETAYWWDRQNWPRRSFGRDAAYIRGLIHLYRYRGSRHHLENAREALHRLASCQLADGSFTDQGDTTGIHAVMNLIVKPWMGCIAVEAMVDFLRWEDDEVIRESALKFCRWLLDCRIDGETGKHWVYQVSFVGGKTYYAFDGTPTPLPGGTGQWHVEYLAKLLGWAAVQTGDRVFYEAWWESYWPTRAEHPHLGDHGANKIVMNLPAQRQELWKATYTSRGVAIHPRTDLAPDLDEAIVSSPDGPIRVTARKPRPQPPTEAAGPGPNPLADTSGPPVELLAYDNGDVSPWLEFFTFDRPSHPKLVRLRKQHQLDELLAGATTDLERAVRLKKWVSGALKFGTPAESVFDDWSAVTLLRRAEEGQVVWCGQAAMVFQQACHVMGMAARFIEVGHPKNPACHFTTEVYLREHGRWAVVDATPLEAYDLYYTVDGVPQSALEMHRHVVDGTMDRVMEVHPGGRQSVRSDDSPAWNFYYVRWLTRCDIVTHTPEFIDLEHVFDQRWHTVEWTDAKTIPWELQKHSAWFIRRKRTSAWRIDDPAVVGWSPTDRVRIVLCPNDAGWIYVHLWTGDLEFDHYEARIDGADWVDLPKKNTRDGDGPTHAWGLRRFSIRATPGEHEARVRVVRHDGAKGPQSFVRFRIPE